MTRPTLIGILCLAAIAGAVVYLVQRPRSTAEHEREAAGWRICAKCGHQWHMELSEIAAQMKQNPDGIGAVRCPKCGAWRGMARAQCPKCHKFFAGLLPVETGDGIRLEKQRVCPHCGYVFGAAETAGESSTSE